MMIVLKVLILLPIQALLLLRLIPPHLILLILNHPLMAHTLTRKDLLLNGKPLQPQMQLPVFQAIVLKSTTEEPEILPFQIYRFPEPLTMKQVSFLSTMRIFPIPTQPIITFPSTLKILLTGAAAKIMGN